VTILLVSVEFIILAMVDVGKEDEEKKKLK
jgi:hypothetical protein